MGSSPTLGTNNQNIPCGYFNYIVCRMWREHAPRIVPSEARRQCLRATRSSPTLGTNKKTPASEAGGVLMSNLSFPKFQYMCFLLQSLLPVRILGTKYQHDNNPFSSSFCLQPQKSHHHIILGF